jgi:hypothetical protein
MLKKGKGIRTMKVLRVLKRSSLTLILVGLVGGLLSSCVSNTPVVLPEITFSHLQPLKLAVSQIRVEQSFEPSQTLPRAETRLNQPPSQVLRRWAKDRLTVDVSGNSGGFARFVILDAKMTERYLDTDGNFTAYFTNEQAIRYEATAEAILEIQSDDGLSQGSARALVSRVSSIAENSTLNEREQALFNLVEGLMTEFNLQMDASVRTHLSQWVK